MYKLTSIKERNGIRPILIAGCLVHEVKGFRKPKAHSQYSKFAD